MPSRQSKTPTKSQEMPASDTPKSPIAPIAHSTEALCDLKSLRGQERRRKMATKGGEWKTKQHDRLPLEYHLSWQAKSPRWDVPANYMWRTRRPHMTPGAKGGWQVNLEDAGMEAVEERDTDWVVESAGSSRPMEEEVALFDLVKPGKRRQGKKTGDFEVVPGSRSVIVLDDYELPEPSVNDPWECINMDDDDREASRKPSYAEVVANPA